MLLGFCVEQLHSDTNIFCYPPHAGLQQVAHRQLASNLTRLELRVPVAHHRLPCQNLYITNLCQVSENVLVDAFGEDLLIF